MKKYTFLSSVVSEFGFACAKRSARQSALLDISLRSDIAYHSPVAHLAIQTLQRHCAFAGRNIADIEMCLHEAALNAVIHGNLELKSDFLTVEAFRRHCGHIESRLADPRFSGRKVHIAASECLSGLLFTVTHEGIPIAASHARNETAMPHGRGLMLIRKLATRFHIAHAGYAVEMWFSAR